MLTPIALGEILTSLLAFWLLFQLHRRDPDPPLRYWAGAFFLQSVTTVLVSHQLLGPEIWWLTAIAALPVLGASVLMVVGTLKLITTKIPRVWLAVPIVAILLSAVLTALGAPLQWRTAPVTVAVGGSLIFVGLGVARDWRRSVGARTAGAGLTLYGLHVLDYSYIAGERPDLLPWGHVLAAFFQVTIAAGLVLLYFERAKGRLAEREAELRALFENAAVGIFVADREGKIVAANETLEQLVAGGEPIVGRTLASFFARPTEVDALLVHEGGEPAARATRWRALDGAELEVQLYVRPVTLDGGGSGRSLLEGVVLDMTRVERLERRLDGVQRGEVLGQLAGGIAHDINNVLMVVLAGADVLDRPDIAPASGEVVRSIRRAAGQGAGLTRQLLAFTRSHPSTTERFELGERVEDALRMLAPALGEDTRLVEELASDGCGVEADPALVEQLVVNLVLNARDATASKGTIRVAVYPCADGPGAPAVVLEVQDDGEGMDGGTLERAFEPFFTTKETGTGLGLAVVQRVVSRSSARLEVRSEPGKGATFVVRFPLVEVWASPPSHPAPDRSDPLRARVLLLDDHADVRAAIAAALDAARMEVVTAESSEAALARIVSGLDADVLVTDVRMPGASGPEVAEAFRARDPEAPVIFISGYSDTEDIVEGADPARTRFLSKPFAPELLVATVRELLRHRRAGSAQSPPAP